MNGNHQLQRQNNGTLNNQLIVQAQSFSGPLPPPQVLADYEKIIPGAAAKILDMAVSQSEHRKSLETKVIDSNIKNSNRGQWFALVTGLVGIIGGVILGIFGKEWVGGVLGGGSLVSLVWVFIYGSNQRKKERSEREKQLSSQK